MLTDADDRMGFAMTPRVRIGLTVLAVSLLLVAAVTGTAWVLDRDDPRTTAEGSRDPSPTGSPTKPAKRAAPPAWKARWAEAGAASKALDGVVEPALSYDTRTLEQDRARAYEGMTSGFRSKYDTLMNVVAKHAPKRQATVQANVVGSAVLNARQGRVALLAFVDQRSKSDSLPAREDKNAVRVDLVRQGDRWRIDELRTAPIDGSGNAGPWSGVRGKRIVRAASDCARTFLTTRADSFESDHRAKLGCTTGKLQQELEQSKDNLRRAVTPGRTNATVKRLATGLRSMSESRATVLVAAEGEVRKGSGSPTSRHYRAEIDLVAEKGTWRLSAVRMR